jgi:hypothetical protein
MPLIDPQLKEQEFTTINGLWRLLYAAERILLILVFVRGTFPPIEQTY